MADLLDAVDMVGFEAELLQELKEAHRHRKMVIFHDFPMVFFMDFPWEKNRNTWRDDVIDVGLTHETWGSLSTKGEFRDLFREEQGNTIGIYHTTVW